MEIFSRQGVALAVEAGCEQGDHGGREQESDDCERDDGEHHGAEYVVEESEGAALAFGLLDAQPHRHEGGVERALRQQAPEEVDDLQDREEGVGENAGAEQRRYAHVAGKSQEPRHQRRAAHRRDVTRERHEAWPPPSS